MSSRPTRPGAARRKISWDTRANHPGPFGHRFRGGSSTLTFSQTSDVSWVTISIVGGLLRDMSSCEQGMTRLIGALAPLALGRRDLHVEDALTPDSQLA